MCQTRHVKARSRRHRRLQNRPTPRLVSPETMRKALQQLLANTERYIIIIRRSGTNPETGDAQDRDLTLFESDQVDLASRLDQRLLRSRRVTIILAEQGLGVARINLTSRSWAILQDSPSLRDRLTSFNSELIAGARSRLITSGWAAAMLFAPLWSSAVLFLIWSISSAKNANTFWGTANPHKPNNFPPVPQWLHGYWHAVLYLWPVFVIICLVILAIETLAGGLRVWPESITLRSMGRALSRIKLSTFTVANASQLIILTVAAIVGGLVVLLLSHL